MSTAWPAWQELSPGWAPPARLGLSLVATEEGRVFAFGGLASAGPVRLRSQDAFTLDLRAANPTWCYVTGSQLPSGATAAGTPPPPRLEQVAGTLIGGRVLVFGGSVNVDGGSERGRAWEPYVVSPNCETPTWRRLAVRGEAPDDAWGYSSCMLGSRRFILLGKSENGGLDLNQLHELTLLSEQPKAAKEAGSAAALQQSDAGSRGSGANLDRCACQPMPARPQPLGGGSGSGGSGGGSGGGSSGGGSGSEERPGSDRRSGDSRGRPAAAHLRPGSSSSDEGGGGSTGDDAAALPAAEGAPAASQPREMSSRRNEPARGLFPVLPLVASGARLLGHLMGGVVPRSGGPHSGDVATAQATEGSEGRVGPSERRRRSMDDGRRASCEEERRRSVSLDECAWRQRSEEERRRSLEERERRRRSLQGRGVEHPPPSHSSGSDEEPPSKTQGV
jgi:hypothetical protein